MTAQVGERHALESRELTMCTEPLESWFEQLRGQGGARPGGVFRKGVGGGGAVVLRAVS